MAVTGDSPPVERLKSQCMSFCIRQVCYPFSLDQSRRLVKFRAYSKPHECSSFQSGESDLPGLINKSLLFLH